MITDLIGSVIDSVAQALGDVDIAAHPAHAHPLDPFTGRLIARISDGKPELVVADEHILVDCGFLWDMLAMRETFRQWCQLTPPEAKLEESEAPKAWLEYGETTGGHADNEADYRLDDLSQLLALGVPTNRPTREDPRSVCQHWLWRIQLPGRTVTYRIGAFRPSIGAMEASRAV